MANPFPFVANTVLTAAELNSIGEKTSFTPSFTNFAIGNGTLNYAFYTQVNDFVSVSLQVTLGSTSVMSSDPRFVLPVSTAAAAASSQLGQAVYNDSATTYYSGVVWSFTGQTSAALGLIPTNSTYAGFLGITSTTPFTWATGDIFSVNFSYIV